MPAGPRSRHELVQGAIDAIIGATYTSFAGWLTEPTGIDRTSADALAAVGVGALFLARLLLGRDLVPVQDEVFVDTWVAMTVSRRLGT